MKLSLTCHILILYDSGMAIEQREKVKNKISFIMRLDKEHVESLNMIAFDKSISRAKLIEEIIEEYLNKKGLPWKK